MLRGSFGRGSRKIHANAPEDLLAVALRERVSAPPQGGSIAAACSVSAVLTMALAGAHSLLLRCSMYGRWRSSLAASSLSSEIAQSAIALRLSQFCVRWGTGLLPPGRLTPCRSHLWLNPTSHTTTGSCGRLGLRRGHMVRQRHRQADRCWIDRLPGSLISAVVPSQLSSFMDCCPVRIALPA